jgi:cyanophycinase
MKVIFTKTVFLNILIWNSIVAFSQGFVMIAGGGGEVAGGWSDAPYRWIVEHAANKRIAVITYDNAATQWVPNYFVTLGAKSAKNFIINSRSAADMQQLYDSLVTYSGIFIKGGDQARYYEYYRGTKTQAAIQYVFDNGGAVSGTSAGTAIISPIVFTAEIASVDPATALFHAYTRQITLKNDFLKTFSDKYIYDTHFIERGRFGRLPAFMATWYKTKNEIATGIGVDDHTALCIDTTGIATAFGTGAVSFIKCIDTLQPFDTSVDMLRSGNMEFSQLLHGCSINLKTGEISGYSKSIAPQVEEENSAFQLFFSGTDYPSDEAYNFFLNETGSKTDAITIVTGSNLSRAGDIKSKLIEKGASEVNIVQAIPVNENDSFTGTNIEKAKKLIFVSNEYSVFMDFLKTSSNGLALKEKIKSTGTISFFVGDNARFAGKTVINRYTGFGATSYNGTMEFLPGLALLQTTAIMPNAFINPDTYENTVSGLPYAMVSDSLKYGFYITGNTFAEYNFTSEGISFFKNLSGSFPLISLKNFGTKAGLANQGPSQNSRNVAGFESMNLKFMGIGDTVITGNNVILSQKTYDQIKLNVFPNPANDILFVRGNGGSYIMTILDTSGRTVSMLEFNNNIDVSLEKYKNGLYLINVTDVKTKNRFSIKLVISKNQT